MPKKIRLDQLLVQRGLAETRAKAQALIIAGEVRVNNTTRTKPGEQIVEEADIEVLGKLPYASRGGYKLVHALDTFGLTPENCIALDIGASTGGFTDVLLQRGARSVYAVDVGYGILDWRLRQDSRVIAIERTNIRYLENLPPIPQNPPPTPTTDHPAQTTPRADCATIDVSFISLRLVLPAARRLLHPDAWIITLIKPQFEAGAAHVGKGGVVRDPTIHAAVLHDILTFAAHTHITPHALTRSPITGPAGNIEFLAWLGGNGPTLDITQAIAAALSPPYHAPNNATTN